MRLEPTFSNPKLKSATTQGAVLNIFNCKSRSEYFQLHPITVADFPHSFRHSFTHPFPHSFLFILHIPRHGLALTIVTSILRPWGGLLLTKKVSVPAFFFSPCPIQLGVFTSLDMKLRARSCLHLFNRNSWMTIELKIAAPPDHTIWYSAIHPELRLTTHYTFPSSTQESRSMDEFQ